MRKSSKIDWDIKATEAENNQALEYLDMTITIVDGKLETDIFAKDTTCREEHCEKYCIQVKYNCLQR